MSRNSGVCNFYLRKCYLTQGGTFSFEMVKSDFSKQTAAAENGESDSK